MTDLGRTRTKSLDSEFVATTVAERTIFAFSFVLGFRLAIVYLGTILFAKSPSLTVFPPYSG